MHAVDNFIRFLESTPRDPNSMHPEHY